MTSRAPRRKVAKPDIGPCPHCGYLPIPGAESTQDTRPTVGSVDLSPLSLLLISVVLSFTMIVIHWK